ncbi:MAG: hypothetical protein ABSF62_17910 [Bryobacteraceae bacterium]|jgi:ribosomal protein L20
MKNVTFRTDEKLIEKARARALREHRTLNAAFREWLERYAGAAMGGADFDRLMRSLSHVKFTRKFTRAEMNAR